MSSSWPVSRASALRVTISSKPGILRPVVIPDYDEVPVFVIRNNLRTAGLSREEYFRLLEQA